VTPSITCTDPSSNDDNCSCTCTDGLTFKQPPPSSSQAGGSGPALAVCEAGKNESLKREQDLMDQLNAKQQELLKREQEFSKELENCESIFKYMGCYANHDGKGPLAAGYTKDVVNTVEACELKCRDFAYFAVENTLYCTCGNSFRNVSPHAPDAECSSKCPGNSSQSCGGSLRASIYAKSAQRQK